MKYSLRSYKAEKIVDEIIKNNNQTYRFVVSEREEDTNTLKEDEDEILVVFQL